MDLRPYVGHEGEGLKAREYLTKREATVEKVFKAVLVSASQSYGAPGVFSAATPVQGVDLGIATGLDRASPGL